MAEVNPQPKNYIWTRMQDRDHLFESCLLLIFFQPNHGKIVKPTYRESTYERPKSGKRIWKPK